MIEELAASPGDGVEGAPIRDSAGSGRDGSNEACRTVGDQSSSADEIADADKLASAQGGKPTSRNDHLLPLLDAVAPFIITPDPAAFFGGLIGVLSSRIAAMASGHDFIQPLLRLLCHALADGLDEELAFQEIVDVTERKSRTQELLAIAAAFLARIASGSTVLAVPATTPAAAPELICAAAHIVREARDSGGTRSWRLLPQFAGAIGERGLPIASLATALPRLWYQFGSGPRDTSAPAPDQPRSTLTGRPPQMILNGAVEIVILSR